MGDLRSPRLILLKGFLFLLLGGIAVGLLLLEHPELRTALLLGIALWSFCRFYYFAFYVVQHYVDDRYRFAGLGSFVAYLWKRRAQPEKEHSVETGPHPGC